MLLYAITNRHLLPGSESNHAALVQLAVQWAERNIDYLQIREKDLAPDDLRYLTEQIVSTVREKNQSTKILLNGPAEIALASGADGVHLPAIAPPAAAAETRRLFAQSGREAILSHACHSIEEVLKVREESQQNPHATTANTLILYAPVFEKLTPEGKLPGQGLEALRAAVQAASNIPVFALGGVTKENVPACLAAGAAGIAGIRLFLESDWLR
ncbi:MAG: thiamine phosphate synthase [Acidobacteriaceae bacterium]